MQQRQLEELLEELRDNLRLRKQLESRMMSSHEAQFEQNDLALENKTLHDQLRAMQQQMQERVNEGLAVRKRLESEKAKVQADLDTLRKDHDTARKELLSL